MELHPLEQWWLTEESIFRFVTRQISEIERGMGRKEAQDKVYEEMNEEYTIKMKDDTREVLVYKATDSQKITQQLKDLFHELRNSYQEKYKANANTDFVDTTDDTKHSN